MFGRQFSRNVTADIREIEKRRKESVGALWEIQLYDICFIELTERNELIVLQISVFVEFYSNPKVIIVSNFVIGTYYKALSKIISKTVASQLCNQTVDNVIPFEKCCQKLGQDNYLSCFLFKHVTTVSTFQPDVT